MARDEAYEAVRWPRAISAGLALGAVIVGLAMLLLAALGCAAATPWHPFTRSAVVVDKALVVLPPAAPGLPSRDRYIVFVGFERQTFRGAVSAEFFLAVQRGDCVVMRGRERGGEIRGVQLSLPCGKRPGGDDRGATT